MRSFRLLRAPAAPTAFAFGLGVNPDDPPPLDCIFRWHNEASDTTLIQFKINLYAELASQVAPGARPMEVFWQMRLLPSPVAF